MMKISGLIFGLALLVLSSGIARAAYVTTLSLNNGSLTPPPFATVEINELSGPDAGKFEFTVTLIGSAAGLNIDGFGFNPSGATLSDTDISVRPTGWELKGSSQFSIFGTFLNSFERLPATGTGQQPLIFVIDAAGDSIATYATLLSTGNGTELFAIKTAAETGAAPFIAGGAVVPIPAALPLFLSGLAVFGFVARRRRSATAA